jgi:signal transduction histidine kinase
MLRSAIAAAGLFLIITFPAFSADPSRPRNVLILIAGEYGLPAYDLVLHEIRNVVKEGYSSPLNWYVEYMDTARFSDFQEEKAVIDFYSQKYKAFEIDLLIAVGPGITPIFRRFGDHLLRGASTLILDVLPSGIELPALLRKPNMTGVFPAADPQGSIEAALTIHPETEHLVIISGASDMDRLLGKLALTASRRYEQRIAVQHFNGTPLAEMLAAVEDLPDHSVILLTAYRLSTTGTAFYTREVTRELAARANSPVYVLFDSNVDVGGVGGHVISFKKVGLEAGWIALRILRGDDPAAISPVREGLLEYQFDWRQLRRWGIPEDRLPEGSMVLHREIPFFEKYFWAVMGAVVFITLQSALIAYLIILNRRQSVLSVRVRKAESRYRELLRIDRSSRLGEMAGSLAHELSQPLTAILSSAQAALRFLKAGRPQPDLLREILEQIVGDDKRAASIINGMRNMLKKRPADRELLDINDMVVEIAAVFQGEAINRHIRVETRFDPSLPPIMASKTQLQQVLLNLMINSAYAMASNRGDDRRMILTTGTTGPNVIVSVRDVGSGIDPDQLDHLFEPFFTTRSEGMGMGLAVCRTIVEDHGGRIRAENNPDRGATFTLELPAVENG